MMKITFLGTAAAPGIPVAFCECSTCGHARTHKGKNIRKRASYIINNDLLVDLGPDLFSSCASLGVSLSDIKYALVSHSHADHFYIPNLKQRAKSHHDGAGMPLLTLVAGPSVMTLLDQADETDVQMKLKRIPFLPYDTIVLHPYHIQSVKANHARNLGDAMNYIIDDGKSRILIASDTGIYDDSVWEHLKDLKLDLLIIECTMGELKGKIHLGYEDVQFMICKLKEMNSISKDAPIYATHFAHLPVPPHDKLEERLQKMGVHCAYDGLEVRI